MQFVAETHLKHGHSRDIYRSKYYNIYKQNAILLGKVVDQFVYLFNFCKAAIKGALIQFWNMFY